jgi:5-methylcytosine-specific restriction endonuclease McrA
MTLPATRRAGTSSAQRRLYDQVITRDGAQCQLKYPSICLTTATTADHILPVSKGGKDRADNLRAACIPCNEHRGDNQDPVTDKDMWSRQWL